jgi:hypothetical protein
VLLFYLKQLKKTVVLKQLNDGNQKRKIQESADAEQNYLILKRNAKGTNKYPIKRSYENDLELFLQRSKVKKTLISQL